MAADAQLIQHHLCLCLRYPVLPFLFPCHIGKDRSSLRKYRMLRKKGDAETVLADHLSFVRFFYSGQDLQKCSLSGSIDPDDPNFVSLLDPERYIIENGFIAIDFTDMFYI